MHQLPIPINLSILDFKFLVSVKATSRKSTINLSILDFKYTDRACAENA